MTNASLSPVSTPGRSFRPRARPGTRPPPSAWPATPASSHPTATIRYRQDPIVAHRSYYHQRNRSAGKAQALHLADRKSLGRRFLRDPQDAGVGRSLQKYRQVPEVDDLLDMLLLQPGPQGLAIVGPHPLIGHDVGEEATPVAEGRRLSLQSRRKGRPRRDKPDNASGSIL